ncbi:MAG: transglutaminase domain-containing protein [Chthonomonas sp.]|nr:transglutaminase domain-containing protein [Chthonomonas sp.]
MYKVLGRLFLGFVSLVLGASAVAQNFSREQSFVISWQGSPVGHCSVRVLNRPDKEPGHLIETTRVTTIATTTGTNEVRTTTQTWMDEANDSDRIQIVQVSAGRRHTVNIHCNNRSLQVDVANGDVLFHRDLPRPANSVLVGDVLSYLPILNEGMPQPNLTTICPTTLKLTTAPIVDLGVSQVMAFGGHELRELSLQDSSSVNSIYVNPSGEVAGLRTSMGMEFRESNAIPVEPEASAPNLARILALQLDRPIEKPRKVRAATFRLSGTTTLQLPNDRTQTATIDGNDTIVTLAAKAARASQSLPIGAYDPEKFQPFLAEESLLPVNHPDIQRVAKKLIGEDTNSLVVARRIRAWVNGHMTADSTIGVARNAVEILKSGEGVCRDAAVLAATLMRASGIPAKLVGGLIADGQELRYHAWVEAFNGREWIPLDPSNQDGFFDATHIKITAGSVEEAFNIRVVRAAKVSLELVRY